MQSKGVYLAVHTNVSRRKTHGFMLRTQKDTVRTGQESRPLTQSDEAIVDRDVRPMTFAVSCNPTNCIMCTEVAANEQTIK